MFMSYLEAVCDTPIANDIHKLASVRMAACVLLFTRHKKMPLMQHVMVHTTDQVQYSAKFCN